MDGAAITVYCMVLINYLRTSSVTVSYITDDVIIIPGCKADVTQTLNHTGLTVPVMKQEMTYAGLLECLLS